MDIKRIKFLKKVILIETLLLTATSFITVSLYFCYEMTKQIIENFIEVSNNVLLKLLGMAQETVIFIIIKVFYEINIVFNNRELAIGFWIFVFIIFVLSIKGCRKEIPGLIKIIFSKSLFIWYLSMILYIFAMIIILTKIGFWEVRLLKDTIIWFLATGIISSARAIGKARDFQYFIDSVKDNIKLIIVFQFVVNLYSFSFIWETILVFIITLISIFTAIIDNKPEFQNINGKTTSKFLNIILVIIGFFILYYSFIIIIVNIKDIIILDLIKAMLMPSILSIIFIFYIYLLVIYAAYEQVFIRLSFKKTIDDKYRFYLKIKILLFCNINITRVNNFIVQSKIMNSYIKSKDDVKNLIRNYKEYRLNDESFV